MVAGLVFTDELDNGSADHVIEGRCRRPGRLTGSPASLKAGNDLSDLLTSFAHISGKRKYACGLPPSLIFPIIPGILRDFYQ